MNGNGYDTNEALYTKASVCPTGSSLPIPALDYCSHFSLLNMPSVIFFCFRVDILTHYVFSL